MGYERRWWPRLLFLHNSFQRHSCRRAGAGLADSLTLRRRSLDNDKIDRAAWPVVVENADRQPSRFPRKRVQSGSALVKQRAVRVIIMAMYDMQIAEASRISLGIAFPQQRLLALVIQRNAG